MFWAPRKHIWGQAALRDWNTRVSRSRASTKSSFSCSNRTTTMCSFTILIAAIALLVSDVFAQQPNNVGNAVVFGEGGTYPRATKLADGSLLGAYTNTQGDNTTILSVRSSDNGASWQMQGMVDTGRKATKDVDNPFIHELPDGKLLCAFRNHDRASSTTYSYYRITICVSDDSGATWEYLSTPASDPAGPTGNWEPFLQQGLDGTLQLYYSRENSATDQDSLLRRSSDGGKTWTSAQVITGEDLETRDGMLGVAHTSANSKNKIAVFETIEPCLLYTSPSPRDGLLSRMPSSA